MPKRKRTALNALDQFEREQRKREEEGAALRTAAALELGRVVLDAGGARLGLADLTALIAEAVARREKAAADSSSEGRRDG